MDIEIPAPRQTLNCVFQGGLTFERAYQGSVLVQGSLGESDIDLPPKSKATRETTSEPSTEEAAVEANSAHHVADDAHKLEAKHAAEAHCAAGGVVGSHKKEDGEVQEEDEDGRTLSDSDLAELLASYELPPPLHPQVGEARALIAERREPHVLHLRLDASAVRGKANIVGTLRSHADPSEVRTNIGDIIEGRP